MKLATRRRNRSQHELSMTSMIDVVFLLLIFFIVTTTFVRPERQIQSAIQVDEKSSERATANLDPAIVSIYRQRSSTFFQIGAVRTNDLDQIKPILKGFENKSEGAFIRPQGNVPFEEAARVVGLCKASGFPVVTYLPAE
jgi:biopolymer transport protein ExbD